eukprot:gene14211-20181_t
MASDSRDAAIAGYRKALLKHKEIDTKVRTLREGVKELKKEYDKTEDDLKALQSVGQIIGEVLRQLDDERYIVKASSGPRYVVGVRTKVDKTKLTNGTRVSLDMTTLTIMRYLPREVDPMVFNMMAEDPGKVDYSSIGGLGEQIRELRESIELPLMNPELFLRVGIKPPKGVLLYGPPGTGKTLLARAIASNIDANFLKVVSSAIVDKYIGESARVIREMFGYSKEHQPCVIFMDKIDAIGGPVVHLDGFDDAVKFDALDDAASLDGFDDAGKLGHGGFALAAATSFGQLDGFDDAGKLVGTSADREIQRTLMELLSQLYGFDNAGKVNMLMAANRPDTLDLALLRPSRPDRKITFFD